MLLTCEVGRERKCLTEGLDVLRHYYYASRIEGADTESPTTGDEALNSSPDNLNAKDETRSKQKKEESEASGPLSLEEEIAMLRGGVSADEVLRSKKDSVCNENTHVGSKSHNKIARKSSSPFSTYETGCRGSVFVVCTLPQCNLITMEEEEKEPKGGSKGGCDDDSQPNTDLEQPAVRIKISEEESNPLGEIKNREKITSSAADTTQPSWDPIETIRLVSKDLLSKDKDAPSSRFVTRMIPIQATCFASMDEIRRTVRPLLRQFLLPASLSRQQKNQDPNAQSKNNASTFQIVFKRRNCDNVRRDEIIDAIGKIIEEISPPGLLAVDFDNPDFTIQIEVCRTLCGMSVVPQCKSLHNFNLFEMRKDKQVD